MAFSGKAKVLIVTGTSLACLFLVLGFRELVRDDVEEDVTPVASAPVGNAVVAVASRTIEVGETITGDMVANEMFDPARHATIATPAEIIGKVAVAQIDADAPISRNWIEMDSNLAIRVPMGMRAVSIDTNAEIAVAGLVRPGDAVDVQVVYPGSDALTGARSEGRSRTETVLQDIQVLAVGEVVVGAPAEGDTLGSTPPPPARTVTLALTPSQVAALSLAKSTGLLLLSLRNPLDTEPAVSASAETLAAANDGATPARAPIRRVMRRPATSTQTARRAPAPKPAHRVDVIIGDQREVITSESSR